MLPVEIDKLMTHTHTHTEKYVNLKYVSLILSFS